MDRHLSCMYITQLSSCFNDIILSVLGYVTDIYGSFMQALAREMESSSTGPRPSIYVGIAGREVEIPFEMYILRTLAASAESTSTSLHGGDGHERRMQQAHTAPVCVISLPQFPDLFVLGDVFLRAAIVVHNLTVEEAPFLVIIPRYTEESTQKHLKSSALSQSEHLAAPSLATCSPAMSLSLHRQELPRQGYGRLLSRAIRISHNSQYSVHEAATPSGIVSTIDLEDLLGIEYITFLQTGSPYQENISVIVDTGSGSLALA